ncbi:MAG TPA: bacillithiol biosynthesis cysteine-adding enzyme BshC [Candidatus Eisenbacteria bacterium]|nr:bacillithiol biosynthesis cysteine-adding enzyme BshC [Candidatus Eisenbacteria bacterium]
MDCRALLPHELPHTTPLIRDFTENFSKLQGFFAHKPELPSVEAYARQLEFPAERRREVAAVLREQNRAFGGGPETEGNLQRLENGAVAIVSGQQVGLLGGPAYSFYKALTVIETARELSRAGVEAVPIFWMATEDHDLDEVRHTTWFHEGRLQNLVLPPPAEPGGPVGNVLLGAEIAGVLRQIEGSFGMPGGEELLQLLRECCRPGETYGSSFGKLFARLFSPHGLILLDPLHPRLHAIAAPILRDALERRDELNEALLQRDKELEKAGYAPQVKVTSKSTLLFTLQEGKREVISAANGKFSFGRNSVDRAELIQTVETAPETFSPNALLRPVVQDFLLPTAAYYGGPAEIAYFAQTEVLYRKLLGRMTVLMPRADYTLVDPKAVRILGKYGLKVEDAWLGPQTLQKKMYGANIPKKLARSFDGSVKQIEKSVESLHKAIREVDPTIQGSVARAEKRIRYQVEKLRAKTGQALDRHSKIIEQHAEFLENLLYPRKGLQSRDLCFLPFLLRLGGGNLGELQRLACTKKPGQHYIVSIP